MIKFNPKSVWKLPQKLRSKFIELYEGEVNWAKMRELLKRSKVYYIDKRGLTINKKEERVSFQDASYILAPFDGYTTKNREQIYAWMSSKKESGFEHTKVGTRYDFDRYIVKNSIEAHK